MVLQQAWTSEMSHQLYYQFVKLAKVQVIGESRRPSLVEFWVPLTTPTPLVDTKSILHGPPQTASKIWAWVNNLDLRLRHSSPVCPCHSSMFVVNLKTFTIWLLGPLLKFKTNTGNYCPIPGTFSKICQKRWHPPSCLSPHALHTYSGCGGSLHTS